MAHNKNQKSSGSKVLGGMVNAGKKAGKKANDRFDKMAYRAGKTAEKIAKPVNDNIFPGLSPEQHRMALIESCINTDEIFNDKITDPPSKGGDDIRNYMFYNQLFFLASAQMLQSTGTGGILPGVVGGLSIIAGAAIMSKDFRNNLKQHAQDALLKYVEPFKESTPKLWQELSAHVESHPGCVSPESLALKLMRYQKQASDMVRSGECDAGFADSLVLKKTSELKASADAMNIDWSDVVSMRNKMAKDMETLQEDRQTAHGADWQEKTVNEMEQTHPGLAGKTGNAHDWELTEEWAPPLDADSVAEKLKTYQNQLMEAVEELNSKKSGETISSKYGHLAGKEESEFFAHYIKKTAELKAYAESVLHVDWGDVGVKYDKMNRQEYDEQKKILQGLYKYVDEPNRNRYMPDGSENKNFGQPNQRYFDDVKKRREAIREAHDSGDMSKVPDIPILGLDGRILDYDIAYGEIEAHNKRMYYELPVDSASAGRCLKKYQQEAYGCVRGLHDTIHEKTDSAKAYTLANDLCKNVRAASDILKFNWQDSVRSYRKDVYTTVLKTPEKAAIWSEMVNGDVIANIPKTKTTYQTDKNGHTNKNVTHLSPKEQIQAWDGALFHSDGSRADDNVLMRVRNPFTEEEASRALYNLFVEDFRLQLQSASIREQHSQPDGKGGVKLDAKYRRKIDGIDDKRKEIEKKRDDLLTAFTSDHFSPDLIDKVERTAMRWFEDAKLQMSGKQKSRDVSLNDSLSPEDAVKPENKGPEFS